jgi:hypothetical protein
LFLPPVFDEYVCDDHNEGNTAQRSKTSDCHTEYFHHTTTVNFIPATTAGIKNGQEKDTKEGSEEGVGGTDSEFAHFFPSFHALYSSATPATSMTRAITLKKIIIIIIHTSITSGTAVQAQRRPRLQVPKALAPLKLFATCHSLFTSRTLKEETA